MKEQCTICGESTEEISVCQSCMDIQEFGYPSFPAYALEEEKQSKGEAEERRFELVG